MFTKSKSFFASWRSPALTLLNLCVPVLVDELLVALLVLGDALVRRQRVDAVRQVENDVLHHLEVVIVLGEVVKVLLLLVEVLEAVNVVNQGFHG